MDKPLHVRVAEALGWTNCRPGREDEIDFGWAWWGREGPEEREERVPHFDIDWAATGPLIERYGITLFEPSVMGYDGRIPGLREAIDASPRRDGKFWVATFEYRNGLACDPADEWTAAACGPTPLLAVCNLILALAAAVNLVFPKPANPSLSEARGLISRSEDE